MNIARIDAELVVVNVEVCDPAWLEDAHDKTAELLVPYTDENPAWIGLSYDPETGIFEQPPSTPPDPPLPEGEQE